MNLVLFFSYCYFEKLVLKEFQLCFNNSIVAFLTSEKVMRSCEGLYSGLLLLLLPTAAQ